MEAGTGSFEKCDHGNDYSAASMRKVRQREVTVKKTETYTFFQMNILMTFNALKRLS